MPYVCVHCAVYLGVLLDFVLFFCSCRCLSCRFPNLLRECLQWSLIFVLPSPSMSLAPAYPVCVECNRYGLRRPSLRQFCPLAVYYSLSSTSSVLSISVIVVDVTSWLVHIVTLGFVVYCFSRRRALLPTIFSKRRFLLEIWNGVSWCSFDVIVACWMRLPCNHSGSLR